MARDPAAPTSRSARSAPSAGRSRKTSPSTPIRASRTSASRSRSSSGTAGPTARHACAMPGLRVTNLIGLGPFHLAHPGQWEQQRERLLHALDAGVTVGAECLVVTTGPAGPLTWEEAADALEEALGPVLDGGARNGHPVRARAHELAPGRRRLRAHAARRHRPRPASRHRCVHGDQRVLGRARPRRDDRRRHRPHPARAGERLRGRAPSRPRTGSSPATATSRSRASSARSSTPATAGASTSSSSARRSRPRATPPPSPVPSATWKHCSTSSRSRTAGRRTASAPWTFGARRSSESQSQVTGPKWNPLVARSRLAVADAAPGQLVSRSSAGKYVSTAGSRRR